MREFGRAGEGVAANKLLELQEQHRRDEAEVRTVKGRRDDDPVRETKEQDV